MIGARAVFQDLLPVFVLIVMGLVVVWIFVSGEQWWKHGLAWAFGGLFVFLAFTYVTGMVAGLRGYSFLKTLPPDALQSIALDGRTLADDSTIHVVSSALRDLRWFSSSHDGWGREVPLRFRLRDGTERVFSAALYWRQHGAVLRGTFGNGRIRRSYDCGFSAELPDVLARLRVPLPMSR